MTRDLGIDWVAVHVGDLGGESGAQAIRRAITRRDPDAEVEIDPASGYVRARTHESATVLAEVLMEAGFQASPVR